MSDPIKHECGIAMLRLRKPLSYYHQKYGTAFYGLNKLYLLMEKQHNRGQDGAGVATIKLNVAPGEKYISRFRSNDAQPLREIFSWIWTKFGKLTEEQRNDPVWLKENVSFTGEVLMGHLRYGTHGDNSLETCHPFLRQNNWKTRNLVLAGNFNMTNASELFDQLVNLGQHPKLQSDTVTVLEKVGHFLDVANQQIFDSYKPEGYNNRELSDIIARELDLGSVLQRSARDFDGGYVIGGLIGHGDAFVLRDPNGIRPAYHYIDDEVVVVASERPVIQTAFDVPFEKVTEIPPGHALIMRHNGEISMVECRKPGERRACSFERIYFSRGTDAGIYAERKQLGRNIAGKVLEAINYDLENTVFSFIPNTAETAFIGLVKGVEQWLNEYRAQRFSSGESSIEQIHKLLELKPRVEKVAVKDVKMRTFITEDKSREELVSHVYDITYGTIRDNVDTLVVLDDSIVRGTTLKRSILSILGRLKPKKIIVVSSAPQIRYPDCYGIDMSKLGDFVAFRALVSLLHENGQEDFMEEVYGRCKAQLEDTSLPVSNELKRLYDQFDTDVISERIAELLRPENFEPEVQVIYQSLEDLHAALPDHNGDWYFSGNYPTKGGHLVANRAFVNYMENRDVRAY